MFLREFFSFHKSQAIDSRDLAGCGLALVESIEAHYRARIPAGVVPREELSEGVRASNQIEARELSQRDRSRRSRILASEGWTRARSRRISLEPRAEAARALRVSREQNESAHPRFLAHRLGVHEPHERSRNDGVLREYHQVARVELQGFLAGNSLVHALLPQKYPRTRRAVEQ